MRVRPFKCIVILVKKALGSGIYQFTNSSDCKIESATEIAGSRKFIAQSSI